MGDALPQFVSASRGWACSGWGQPRSEIFAAREDFDGLQCKEHKERQALPDINITAVMTVVLSLIACPTAPKASRESRQNHRC